MALLKLYAAAARRAFTVFLSSCVVTVFFMGSIRYQYLRPVDFFLSPVSPVSSQPPDLFPGNAFHLQKRLFNGMPVIFVPKGLGPQDYSGNQSSG